MAYVAVRRLHMGDEVYREPGELVPEAANWKNLRVWLGSHVKEVPDAEVAKAEPKARKPKAEPKAEPEATPEDFEPKADEPAE